ncbi:MAG: hypothetical protein JRJ11_02340 [Deltaproteobacteria bacterium]|nr:hypothetical protein [Deltaproteobacteria bacterium]
MEGCVIGIDIGSASSKGVIFCNQKTMASYVMPSGGNYQLTADKIREELLSSTGLSPGDIVYTVATGYGAETVTFADDIRADISCHSKGIFHLFPSVRTTVDVGDLHSKAFRIDEKGNQLRFLLSGKCAGFNTGCAVFAESEAVGRIAEGVAKEDLLAGIHRALAAQLYSLAERIGIERDFALVGGGARDVGLIKAMEEITNLDILVPAEPHLTAALGAAIIAEEISKA